MRIFIVCSKYVYDKVEPIKNSLKKKGHIVTPPNCFDDPFKEEELKKISVEEHQKFKEEMIKLQKIQIQGNDAILVLNLSKNGQENYIGGSTFLEIFQAWELGKKIFLYNPPPENNFKDEILGMNPTIIYKNLSRVM